MQRIVVFDGECILCNKLFRFIIKRMDKRHPIYFTALKSRKSEALFKAIGERPFDNTIYYFRVNKHFIKSKAISRILKDMGGAYRIPALLIQVFPVKFADFTYDIIANNRYNWFGKTNHCEYSLYHQKFIIDI